MTAHLYVDDTEADAGVRRARIVCPHEEREFFFERLDGPLSPDGGADPFLLATLHFFMHHGVDVEVHGPVTARLLRGIEELQGIWSLWRPEVYRRVEITCDEVTDPAPRAGDTALSAFSGGVDACYTVQRHALGLAGRDRVDLREVLLIQGFDVRLSDDAGFRAVVDRAERQLAGLGLGIRQVRTDVQAVFPLWEDSFGAAVGACLLLFHQDFDVALIASGGSYADLAIPGGSSPLTDHLFSTSSMDVRHDGATASRTQKVASLADWPNGYRHLRVCFQGTRAGSNCGRCQKCIRTYLNLRAAGIEDFSAFDSTPTPRQIRRLKVGGFAQAAGLDSVLAYADAQGRTGDWVDAMRHASRTHHLKLALAKAPGVGAVIRRLRG